VIRQLAGATVRTTAKTLPDQNLPRRLPLTCNGPCLRGGIDHALVQDLRDAAGVPAPDVEYATRPAGVLQYMILGLISPG
jgi:hypothetical protein